VRLDIRDAPATLERDGIARRIPHQGAMCLLDRVIAWDRNQIACEASGHRAASNPLRAFGRLGASCGVEYAAQAMAVHGALIAEAEAIDGGTSLTPKTGYLAGIRGLTLYVERLDDLPGLLAISAERLSGDGSTILYGFSLHAGTKLLVSGRAMVILNAAALVLRGHSDQ
jgi:predicted hotdog family 3-hydroxylacyl-ACP dehydratase